MSRFLLTVLWILCSLSPGGWAQTVEVKNNSFYIDGQKFFVKGIGFEISALPGELPWNKTFNPDQLHFDIQRIISGGFNTIRTWAPFSAQELELLQQYDIKIIMGIWINPQGDFSDAGFVNEAKATVRNVLSYSKNYNNIIAYLIMNEPLPEAIFKAGYKNTVALWKELTDIIHTQHPNRPVSIANTSVGTYIKPDIFDFSAYNVYIYNPVTVNYLHGYRDFIHYLQQMNEPGHPLIITEYGLSVSPTGPGNWGYGGNSLAEQQEGILHMYKGLVDGGAYGSCVFNYSDGWWKAGNEFVHDDAAEEWFGLVEYTSLTDKQGEERPAWKTVSDYQSAIITQPGSPEIYLNKVPVEIFLNDTIKRIDVMLDSNLICQWETADDYLTDTLVFDTQEIKDQVLVFNCYDTNNNLIKSEEKSILITADELDLPDIQITTNDDFWQTGSLEVTYQINKSDAFTTDTKLSYIYYPHVGWDYGQKFMMTMPSGQQVTVTRRHAINSNVNVFTVGAAFDISYKSFRKRVYNQMTLTRSDEEINGMDRYLSAEPHIIISPNPATKYFTVASDGTSASSSFDYVLYNLAGMVVKQGIKNDWNSPVDISQLNPGLYYIRINCDSRSVPVTDKLLKF